MVNIQLGEVIFGGVGAGLYGMLVMVVLTVFIAGLMVGRTPEYLGKKMEAARDEARDALHPRLPGRRAHADRLVRGGRRQGTSSLNNAGPHGLSELLYAYSSGAGNNGSAFAGLNGNTHVLERDARGVDMLVGRFLMIIPALAIAGSMVGKKVVAPGPGHLPHRRARRSRPCSSPSSSSSARSPSSRRCRSARCSSTSPRSPERCSSHGRPESEAALAVRPRDRSPGRGREPEEARPAPRREEPGHVRGGGRGACSPRSCGCATGSLHPTGAAPGWFTLAVSVWLWFTVSSRTSPRR